MRLAAALGLALVLAGCSSKDPTLYTLGERPGAVRAVRPQIVAVRNVIVPRYLERQGIVRREGDRLVVADSDWWGETVAAMMRRVLAANLALRLPGATVLATDGIAGERPDVEVELDLQRFEPDGSQVMLEGVAAVTGQGRPRTLGKVAVRVPYAGQAARGQVDAMSDALGQASDAMAASIAR